MKRLKFRGGSGGIPSQETPVARRGRWTKWIYIASLFGIFIWLSDLMVGSFLYFRGDGMVLAQPATVATEYPARLREINVREGDHVEAGQIIGQVSSQSVIESIARLTAEFASQRTRLAELRIRTEVIDAVSGLAKNRAKMASETRKEFERLHERGLLPSTKRSSAADNEFTSRRDMESLSAEGKAIEAELGELSAALRGVGDALTKLLDLYDDGQLRAPVTGIVSQVNAAQGAVVKPGEIIIQLHSGRPFVLAYVPAGALFQLAAGDRVVVSFGLDEVGGTIERLEAVAAALPREFQKSFKPVERAQLARILLDPKSAAPPLFSKVRVSAAGLMPSWVWRIASGDSSTSVAVAQAPERN